MSGRGCRECEGWFDFKKWRQYLDRLVDEGRLSANPALSVRLHYYDYRPKEVLTRGELLQLFFSPCSHPEVKRVFLFSCLCGLRWCDIKQLQVDDVDYQRQLLYIMSGKKFVLKNNLKI